jgi:Fe-S-cluster containining protein
MAKRRARKTRPAPRGRSAGAPRQTTGDSGANLRRFTLSGWAVVAQTMRQRRDQAALLDLLGFFDWLGDSNLEAILRGRPPLPCWTGCSFCCYVGPDRPDLLPAELLRIVSYLRDPARAATLAEVLARLRAAPDKGAERKAPCFFLHEGRCAIYAVRPMRCRAQHSPDREACERYFVGEQGTMPLIREPALLYKSLQIGMRTGLHEAGLQDVRLAMDAALRVALLKEPDAPQRWLQGQAVFDRAALPERADEGQLLAQLRRQARGQVRAEARRLHKVLLSLLERPGAWALYSTTGESPLT